MVKKLKGKFTKEMVNYYSSSCHSKPIRYLFIFETRIKIKEIWEIFVSLSTESPFHQNASKFIKKDCKRNSYEFFWRDIIALYDEQI